MAWTESEIKKIVKKYESVDIYRELEDREATITVYYDYTESERSYFNALKGEGHPGSDAEVELILSLDCNRRPVELTEGEKEQALEKIYSEIEYDEDPPDSYDREKDQYD